jgi:excisionase family DNA binding protein
MANQLYTTKQAAAELQVSIRQVRGLVHDGELRYINVSRGKKKPRMRFADEDIAEFKERRRRRETCLSGAIKSRPSTNTRLPSEIIGFAARRKQRIAAKRKP